MLQVSVYCWFWTIMLMSTSQALTCFETNEDGYMTEITNINFTYCILTPERTENGEYIPGKAFGIGLETESTEAYDAIFKPKNRMYKVLSMCIYERYDFGKISSRLSFKEPEFMLRCFCNFDNCNREKNFFAYINNLKADSAINAV